LVVQVRDLGAIPREVSEPAAREALVKIHSDSVHRTIASCDCRSEACLPGREISPGAASRCQHRAGEIKQHSHQLSQVAASPVWLHQVVESALQHTEQVCAMMQRIAVTREGPSSASSVEIFHERVNAGCVPQDFRFNLGRGWDDCDGPALRNARLVF
jgi:hypothetical protein